MFSINTVPVPLGPRATPVTLFVPPIRPIEREPLAGNVPAVLLAEGELGITISLIPLFCCTKPW